MGECAILNKIQDKKYWQMSCVYSIAITDSTMKWLARKNW